MNGKLSFESHYAQASSLFGVGEHSIHGQAHWRRVEDAAIQIAADSGADLVVVRLFAIYHDVCRLDDGSDPDHGRRASALVSQMAEAQLPLDAAKLELLVHAIAHHVDGLVSSDPTIGTCWDADRLDLGRVGVLPSPELMSTAIGREMARMGSRYWFINEKKS